MPCNSSLDSWFCLSPIEISPLWDQIKLSTRTFEPPVAFTGKTVHLIWSFFKSVSCWFGCELDTISRWTWVALICLVAYRFISIFSTKVKVCATPVLCTWLNWFRLSLVHRVAIVEVCPKSYRFTQNESYVDTVQLLTFYDYRTGISTASSTNIFFSFIKLNSNQWKIKWARTSLFVSLQFSKFLMLRLLKMLLQTAAHMNWTVIQAHVWGQLIYLSFLCIRCIDSRIRPLFS